MINHGLFICQNSDGHNLRFDRSLQEIAISLIQLDFRSLERQGPVL